MIEEKFYTDKIFKMVEDCLGLVTPFGILSCADKDFLSFELSFFYYFIYDYKVFHELDSNLRRKILHKFFEKIQRSRPTDFKNIKDFDQYYEKRIFSYFRVMQETQKIGEFGKRCADYINTLLTFSENKNVYTCYTMEQAERELKPQIEPNKYTKELEVVLTVSSSPLLIAGVDPVEISRTNGKKTLFNKIKNFGS